MTVSYSKKLKFLRLQPKRIARDAVNTGEGANARIRVQLEGLWSNRTRSFYLVMLSSR